MNIALRAAADRCIYDVAALRTVAESLDDAEFAAVCPATSATVGETFAKVVGGYRAAFASLAALIESDPVVPDGWPGQPAPAATGPVAPDDVDEFLATALCDLVGALAALPEAMATNSVASAVTTWSTIGAAHALDSLKAVPDLALDPLLLNWAVFPTPGEPPGLHERRLAVMKRARKNSRKTR